MKAYPDGSGYEARFTKCGICTLMSFASKTSLTAFISKGSTPNHGIEPFR